MAWVDQGDDADYGDGADACWREEVSEKFTVKKVIE